MVVGGGGLCRISWFADYVGLLEERDKEEEERDVGEKREQWVVYIIWLGSLYYFNELYVKTKVEMSIVLLNEMLK